MPTKLTIGELTTIQREKLPIDPNIELPYIVFDEDGLKVAYDIQRDWWEWNDSKRDWV